MILRIVMMCLLIGTNYHLWAAKLESLHVQNSAQDASVVCVISGYFKFHAFSLNHPDRVVVDLEQTTTQTNPQTSVPARGIVTRMRTGHPTSHTLRLVFDVQPGVSIKNSLKQSVGHNLQKLQINLVKNGATAHVQIQNANNSRIVVKEIARTIQTPSNLRMRDVVVVIDPGHGGHDPGALGMGHHAEKQVVLAIALKLKQLIDKQPGMRAILTRNGDYYVGLRQRMSLARRYNADVFVAIHADAFNNPNSNGASVFALSARGATSEAARWIAAKENHSELGGVNLSGLDDQNGVIRTVLIDLSQTATIGASLQMGGRVLRGLDTITTLHNNKVEQARFVVLKSPDIPSILIETGFISNPREERNLTNPSYQMRLTQAIFTGIKSYFWDYPPHGSRVEALSGGGMHLVRAGESLPMIASRYHVSSAQIQRANGLSSSNVKAGQTLSIPASWA